jgi:hypothetical protein
MPTVWPAPATDPIIDAKTARLLAPPIIFDGDAIKAGG